MSIPEHTPAAEAPIVDPEVSKAPMAVPETETATSPKVEEPVVGEPAAVSTTEEPLKKEEAAAEVTPATEGVLGYKAPGIFKQFRYVKHHFWLSEEPLKSEHLATYIRDEKTEIAHPNAAWAQETGKGVLFYSKRAEDKTTPAGLIMMADVSDVTSEGTIAFHFKTGTHTHKFEAANMEERASWLAAIEAQSTEAKAMKDTVTGSDSYKKTLENYTKSPVLPAAAAVAASKSTSRPPKKSLDAATATAATTPAVNGATDGTTEEETPKETKTKSRSQSRKRTSIFGTLRAKKDEKDEQKDVKKEEKAEEKAEKKQEKEVVKHEKKAEAATKKEEAKEEHDSGKAKEAAEAAAVAAVPAAAIAAEKKHEEKTEEKTGATTPTDKKAKRSSVFGSLFKKNPTSPTAEKTEKEVGPTVPAKDMDALPVAETAPQIEEPIESKPIDTAAVVAPVDTVTTPAAEEPMKEMTSETPAVAKSEEKGGPIGFLKKQQAKFASKKEQKEEKKEEKKEETAAETIAKDPVVAAAPTETPATTETTPATEERPARDSKRRTSLFGSLGTQKKKTESGSEDTTSPLEKREKSPLPSKLTGLFRKPSKAVKPTETPATTETTEATDAAKSETMTNGEAVPESTESKIVGDVVPDELHTTVHDSVTSAPSEVKASA